MKEMFIKMAISPGAFSIYGSLVSMILIYLAGKILGKKYKKIAYRIALQVAKDVEDKSKEGTREDNFLDKVIERLEKVTGSVPSRHQIDAIKHVKQEMRGEVKRLREDGKSADEIINQLLKDNEFNNSSDVDFDAKV